MYQMIGVMENLNLIMEHDSYQPHSWLFYMYNLNLPIRMINVNESLFFIFIFFFSVDFALKVVKWSESQTIKLQLWDIAGKLRCYS